MSDIIKIFEKKLEQEELAGIIKWSSKYKWEDRKILLEHLKKYNEDPSISQTQHTIILLLKFSYFSVLNLNETNFLNEETIDDTVAEELIVLYELKNPEKKYNEIKARIASPESFLTRIPYIAIKALYEKGKIPFDRQIFVACLIRFNVWHKSYFTKELEPEAAKKVDRIFPKDAFSLDILMAVFEMELGVDGAFYLEHQLNIGAIIIKLVKDGTLARTQVQQKIFEAFNNPTLKQSTQTWVKNVYLGLDFSKEENLACQAQLIELMYNNISLISNFALKQLKQISTHKTFDWSSFIDSLDGIVYRKKFNGGLKIALAMLQKKLAKEPQLAERICLNLSPIFIQEESSIQAEALKCFVFLKEKSETINEALEPFVSTMHSETKSALSSLLSNESMEEKIPYEHYSPKAYTPTSIQNLEKLKYIEKEEDFIFLCTKVLKSSDALDYELFLEGILRFYHLKDTQKKALGSALKMAKKMVASTSFFSDERLGLHHSFVAKLICMWLNPQEPTIDDEIANWKNYQKTKHHNYEHIIPKLLALYKLFDHINFIDKSIKNDKPITLLSTPTHTNGAIDVDVFFKRLSVYEQNNTPINESDFSLAICRLNRWSTYQEPKEYKSEYRDILSYILNDKAKFDNTKIKNLENCWVIAFTLKNPEKSIPVLDLFLNEQPKWWTAKAANLFQFGRRYSGQYSWPTINIKLKSKHIDNNYKNSQIVKINHFSYFLLNYGYIVADASNWFLKSSYCLEPLFLYSILSNYQYIGDLEAREKKSTMAILLESIKNPIPLEQNGMMFLCLSLFASDSTVRTTALDYLLVLIEKGYLNLELFSSSINQMLCNEHHPIPIKRVSEQFEQLIQMGGIYSDVLHFTLQENLTKINPENLPKSFKDILHFYYEIISQAELKVPQNVKENLEAMLKQNTVKKEAKKILML